MSKKNMQLIKDKISGIFSGKSGKRNMYIAVASLMVIIFAVVIIITLNNSGNKDGEQQTISEILLIRETIWETRKTVIQVKGI